MVTSSLPWMESADAKLRLSVLAGDVLFNLRSVLDHLVCGLVRKHYRHHECETLSFPLRVEERRYSEKCLDGVPPEAKGIIRGLQPFQRPSSTRAKDPLWLLTQLNNRHKHRGILMALALNKHIDLVLRDPETGRLLFRVAVGPQETIGSITVAVPPTIPNPVHIEIGGKFPITFREAGPWEDRPVDEIWQTCLHYVEDNVVARLKPCFYD